MNHNAVHSMQFCKNYRFQILYKCKNHFSLKHKIYIYFKLSIIECKNVLLSIREHFSHIDCINEIMRKQSLYFSTGYILSIHIFSASVNRLPHSLSLHFLYPQSTDCLKVSINVFSMSVNRLPNSFKSIQALYASVNRLSNSVSVYLGVICVGQQFA